MVTILLFWWKQVRQRSTCWRWQPKGKSEIDSGTTQGGEGLGRGQFKLPPSCCASPDYWSISKKFAQKWHLSAPLPPPQHTHTTSQNPLTPQPPLTKHLHSHSHVISLVTYSLKFRKDKIVHLIYMWSVRPRSDNPIEKHNENWCV